MIKPRINVLAAMLMAWIGVNAQVAFTGDESHKIFEEVPAKNTGLDMV